MKFRTRVARRLRFLADRVDPTTGPRRMTAVSGFTFEEGIGVVFRDDGRGCPLWYMAQDHDRAHDEAGDLVVGHVWARDRTVPRLEVAPGGVRLDQSYRPGDIDYGARGGQPFGYA